MVLGFGKRGLLEKGSLQKILEIPENLEILEMLGKSQTVESKGESDHFLDVGRKFQGRNFPEWILVKKFP